MRRRYLIVLEETPTGYSGFVPDVPGCIATGRTLEQTELTMQKALRMHIEALRREGLPIPDPTSCAAYVQASDDP